MALWLGYSAILIWDLNLFTKLPSFLNFRKGWGLGLCIWVRHGFVLGFFEWLMRVVRFGVQMTLIPVNLLDRVVVGKSLMASVVNFGLGEVGWCIGEHFCFSLCQHCVVLFNSIFLLRPSTVLKMMEAFQQDHKK